MKMLKYIWTWNYYKHSQRRKLRYGWDMWMKGFNQKRHTTNGMYGNTAKSYRLRRSFCHTFAHFAIVLERTISFLYACKPSLSWHPHVRIIVRWMAQWMEQYCKIEIKNDRRRGLVTISFCWETLNETRIHSPHDNTNHYVWSSFTSFQKAADKSYSTDTIRYLWIVWRVCETHGIIRWSFHTEQFSLNSILPLHLWPIH